MNIYVAWLFQLTGSSSTPDNRFIVSLNDKPVNGHKRSVCTSSYDAHGKFEEHKRRVIVAQSASEGNSSFLSARQTSQGQHNSINAQPNACRTTCFTTLWKCSQMWDEQLDVKKVEKRKKDVHSSSVVNVWN